MHDSSKPAACSDVGDAPRVQRWIPAEPLHTRHHNPATECEQLHRNLDVKPDFLTDAQAKVTPHLLLCWDEISSGRKERF